MLGLVTAAHSNQMLCRDGFAVFSNLILKTQLVMMHPSADLNRQGVSLEIFQSRIRRKNTPDPVKAGRALR